VHVILLDDLKRDPAGTYARTLRFLGVDGDFRADFRVHNVAGPAPDSLLYRVWKASTLRYRIRSAVPQRLYTTIREQRRRRLQRRAGRRSADRLEPGLRRRLQSDFAGEIDRLERLLDRDLAAWRVERS
jgi:hypothetical protein